jgi:hypothetical protein
MKRFWWFVAVLCGIGMATGQTSPQNPKLETKADPLRSETQPLTPKSAMPASHKTSLPRSVPNSSRNTSAELQRLERENSSASSRDRAQAAKLPPVKSVGKAEKSNPPINSKYQKPVGGMTASGAGNGRSSGNRVKK